MTGRTLAEEYLSAIERGDLDAILALFGPGATVHSPLYGPLPATEFYPRLLADTGRAELHLRGVTQDERLGVSGSGSTGPSRLAPRPTSKSSTCWNSTRMA